MHGEIVNRDRKSYVEDGQHNYNIVLKSQALLRTTDSEANDGRGQSDGRWHKSNAGRLAMQPLQMYVTLAQENIRPTHAD